MIFLVYPAPPVAHLKLEGQLVREGVVKLICSVTGDGPVSISWQKDGVAFGMANHRDVFMNTWVKNATSILTFPQLQRSDSGRYACLAKNVQIVDIVHRTAIASVDVRVKDPHPGELAS